MVPPPRQPSRPRLPRMPFMTISFTSCTQSSLFVSIPGGGFTTRPARHTAGNGPLPGARHGGIHMPRPVVKRTARAILLDTGPHGLELIVIKRPKPGRPPYWITPGGCVEPEDPTVVDALHRELSEELGGKAADV